MNVGKNQKNNWAILPCLLMLASVGIVLCFSGCAQTVPKSEYNVVVEQLEQAKAHIELLQLHLEDAQKQVEELVSEQSIEDRLTIAEADETPANAKSKAAAEELEKYGAVTVGGETYKAP